MIVKIYTVTCSLHVRYCCKLSSKLQENTSHTSQDLLSTFTAPGTGPKHFTWVNAFNLHTHHLEEVLLTLCYTGENNV